MLLLGQVMADTAQEHLMDRPLPWNLDLMDGKALPEYIMEGKIPWEDTAAVVAVDMVMDIALPEDIMDGQ
ncbi:hypothetical protein GCK32_012467, partial [Trichostrongylus colubriformis]